MPIVKMDIPEEAVKEISVKLFECHCMRCGAVWLSQLTQDEKGNWITSLPQSCSKCKLPRWWIKKEAQPTKKSKK